MGMLIMAGLGLAQSTANTDFNPFPQMEQDMNDANNQAMPAAQQQNDDWPPSNNNSVITNEGQQ